MNSETVRVDWHDLPFHPVANLFPLIDGPQFDALVSDIAANGLLEPIWLHSTDNAIIDGRNRYRACLAAGVAPTFRRWHGSGSLTQFVLSLNLHRRHLTSSQLACVGVEVLPGWKKRPRNGRAHGTTYLQHSSIIWSNVIDRRMPAKQPPRPPNSSAPIASMSAT